MRARAASRPIAFRHVSLVQQINCCQVSFQRLLHRLWQHRDAVLFALTIVHDELLIGKIHIFHPQTETFHQTQTHPIEQTSHQPACPIELCQHGLHLCHTQHMRDTPWLFRPFDPPSLDKTPLS